MYRNQNKQHKTETPNTSSLVPPLPNTSCSLCKRTTGGHLMVKSCLHTFCEECFWLDYLERSKLCTSRRQICCLVCKHPYWKLGLGLGTHPRKSWDSDSSTDHTPVSPQDIKARSLAKWLKLAPSIGAHTESRQTGKGRLIPKRPTLEALPLHLAVTLYPGSVRPTRCEKFLEAAYTGNNLRISAIMQAGVNVDARNEYGQTAVFIAAQHGHYETVQTLVEGCGADAAIVANGGVTPVMAATANGHHHVVCVYECIRVYMHVCMCVYVCVYLSIHPCMYICMHLYMYVHIYILCMSLGEVSDCRDSLIVAQHRRHHQDTQH